MGTNREALYYYTVKYRGNYRRIQQAVLSREPYESVYDPVSFLCIGDPEYPAEFYKLKSPPGIVFYEGDLSLLQTRKIAIVGSRIQSDYGKTITAGIASAAGKRYTVVSGMAKGTDAIAQSHAERTIGILGNGLDVIYPKCNAALYDKVRREGLLLSEYPPAVSPSREAFPFRNRLIAALGEKLIVPSCRIKGGTLTTVNAALELGKEVITVPYPIDDLTGDGCNRLIRDGAEFLVSLEDVADL